MIEKKIATVGLGLMGCSIATCLLAAGYEVTSLIRNISKSDACKERIFHLLEQLHDEQLLTEEPECVIRRLTITDNVSDFSGQHTIIESIVEDVNEKKQLFRQLEEVVAADAVIGSNTSAIPVTLLQDGLKHPERFLGIHWGEPAHISKFLEVICGSRSDIKYAERIIKLAEGWRKEPTLIKKDIRGFITNRMMYALLREAFYLVEGGYADFEDIDRACRNDLGFWMTFAGPFRFMDITGIPAYLSVMKDLFPELSNSAEPPQFVKDIVASGAKGVSNAKGFYQYTNESAERWEKLFLDFTLDIRKISEKYPQNGGDIE